MLIISSNWIFFTWINDFVACIVFVPYCLFSNSLRTDLQFQLLFRSCLHLSSSSLWITDKFWFNILWFFMKARKIARLACILNIYYLSYLSCYKTTSNLVMCLIVSDILNISNKFIKLKSKVTALLEWLAFFNINPKVGVRK